MLRSTCILCILFIFLALIFFLLHCAPLLGLCLLADSTANHHSDVMMFCQSAEVPAVFEDLRWLWCVCATPACLVLQRGQQFHVHARCLSMLNVSCLKRVMFCVVLFDLFIDLIFGYWLVSNSSWKMTLMSVLGVSVLLHVKFNVNNAFWCIKLLNQIRRFVIIQILSQSLL